MNRKDGFASLAGWVWAWTQNPTWMGNSLEVLPWSGVKILQSIYSRENQDLLQIKCPHVSELHSRAERKTSKTFPAACV
jgi:hypothetical protein